MIVSLFLAMTNPGAGKDGDAGRESLFSIGVDARTLGLGGAAVAYPDDPSAFHWNPAGMIVVQKRTLGISTTTLFEGTDYYFLGYVHPTLSIGTFGLGIYYMGTGGILQTEWDASNSIILEGDEFGYWSGRLTMAYALTLFKGFSTGINLNVLRQVLYTNSTNGFGVDLGLHYALPVTSGPMSNLYLGVQALNLLSPRFKLGVSTEKEPMSLRGGFAKLLQFRDGKDRWMLLADVTYVSGRDIGFHVGTEYSWSDILQLRIGYDNGELAFGGGVHFKNFQIDYATSRIGDPLYFSRSHRFSVVYSIGKSIPDRRRLLEEQRDVEIQQQITQRMEADRQRRISEGIRIGKEFFDRGDYFNARLEFSRVLAEDSENQEAKNLLSETAEKERIVQRQREDELLRRDRANEKAQRDNAFISQRFSEGLEYMEKGDYQKAIASWEEALQRDPENPQIKEYISKARIEMSNDVDRTITAANQLIRQDNLSEAYRQLNRMKEQTEGHPDLQDRILAEMRNLDRIINFLPNYQEGQQRFNNKDYEGAARSFQRALQFDPNHVKAQEFYRISVARSRAIRSTEMTEEVRTLFNNGIKFYNEGHYEKALEEWQKALDLDPYNEHLLRAIDGAKRKLETYKKEKK